MLDKNLYTDYPMNNIIIILLMEFSATLQLNKSTSLKIPLSSLIIYE